MNRTVMDDNNRDSKCDNAREQTYQLQNKPKRSRKNKLYNDTQIV